MRRTKRALLIVAGVVLVLLFGPVLALWATGNRAFIMPTGSMEDTIAAGDRFLVSSEKTVQRGDIVAYIYPVDPAQTFMKRIAGVPGDRIRIVNKQLFLNGVAVEEPYVTHKTAYVDSFRDNFPSEANIRLEDQAEEMLRHVVNGELVVPPGNYFVLGDNRDSSLDSRFIGFVPQENILGKPWLFYYREDGGLTLQRIEDYPLGR